MTLTLFLSEWIQPTRSKQMQLTDISEIVQEIIAARMEISHPNWSVRLGQWVRIIGSHLIGCVVRHDDEHIKVLTSEGFQILKQHSSILTHEEVDEAMTTDIIANLSPEMRTKYTQTNPAEKIAAIKRFREETNSGLKEAKMVVEALMTRDYLPAPYPPIGQPVVIEVCERLRDYWIDYKDGGKHKPKYHAQLPDGNWACGRTRQEAIGDLVSHNLDKVKIIVKDLGVQPR